MYTPFFPFYPGLHPCYFLHNPSSQIVLQIGKKKKKSPEKPASWSLTKTLLFSYLSFSHVLQFKIMLSAVLYFVSH